MSLEDKTQNFLGLFLSIGGIIITLVGVALMVFIYLNVPRDYGWVAVVAFLAYEISAFVTYSQGVKK
jgi:hypothetical protein